MSSDDAEAFGRSIAAGGVVVFPADTVYGLACDPENPDAVERLYALKGRRPDKPAAVMFFELEAALAALPELGPRTRAAMATLLPGAVTLLVPNPARRFPLAGGSELLGIRVPRVPRLGGVRRPVLQSSANLAGGPDARSLAEVPEEIRARADLVIDGGDLPGTPSTVIDLREYDADGPWHVVREGAVGQAELEWALGGQFHFRPEAYETEIVAEMPGYHELQRELIRAGGAGARRILELGTGTGVTAQLLLEHHPDATLVGVDASAEMLAAARSRLPARRVELHVGRIEDELPDGPFDLVASALCVHHLDGAQKAELFRRVRDRLVPGGRFILGDLVIPDDPADAETPFTPGFDKPSTVPEQLEWMCAAGLEPRLVWQGRDLVIFVADAPAAGIVAAP